MCDLTQPEELYACDYVESVCQGDDPGLPGGRDKVTRVAIRCCVALPGLEVEEGLQV